MTAVAPVRPIGAAVAELVYVGFADPSHTERHISLVPLLPGLEALCGQPLLATSGPGPRRRAVHAVTCDQCRRAVLPMS